MAWHKCRRCRFRPTDAPHKSFWGKITIVTFTLLGIYLIDQHNNNIMKLAIATGVIAQALPTLSRKTTVNLTPQESPGSFANALSLTTDNKNKDADGALVNTHSRRRALLANLPATKKGLLRNQQRRVNKQDVKPCNPASNDPDIGILSCGTGMFCKPMEDSLLGGRCELNESNFMGWSKLGNGHHKGGFLKNMRAESFNDVPVECDPESTADIGILSCGNGQHCVASSLSSKGGFCMQSSASRQLADASTTTCDPSLGLSSSYNCDCSGLDNITGTGDVTCTNFKDYCLGLVYAGCGTACLSSSISYSFLNSTATAYNYCVDFKTPYEQKVCIATTYATETCVVTLNDQPCNACSIQAQGNATLISFDCSNAGGTNGTTNVRTELLPILASCYTPEAAAVCTLCPANNTVFDPNSYYLPVSIPNLGNFTCNNVFYNSYAYVSIAKDYCPAVSAATAGACCASVCELCDSGTYIPPKNYNVLLDIPLNGFESATCGNLYTAAYYNLSITGDLCPSAASVAKSKCCVPYVENDCDVCDGAALAYPDAVVSIYGYDLRCTVLQKLLNETVCAAYQPRVAATCCGTQNSDIAPTSAPQASPSEPSPSSSSSPVGLATHIVSTIGVATIALILLVK